CPANRPAGRDCGARPKYRQALRTACGPNGRCAFRSEGQSAIAKTLPPIIAPRFHDLKTTCSYREFHAIEEHPPAQPWRRAANWKVGRSWRRRKGMTEGKPPVYFIELG